jgi:hypothetical protein
MKHNKEGLARPCRASDLFLVVEGLQCGNCLAVDMETWRYNPAKGHSERVYDEVVNNENN